MNTKELYELFENDKLVVMYSGEWENDYKDYDSKESVVEYEGKFYMIQEHRSGSYYSDHEYSKPDIFEVEGREEITVKWYPV